jgi:sulfide:quinone oxidoreductase
MADSYWKSTGNKYSSSFITGMPTMFAVSHYAKALNAIREEKGISGTFNTNLVEVRPDTKSAVFEVLAGEDKGKKIEKEFGLLHVVPPMGPLDFVKNSPLADAAGWVDVDQGTLQHKKYENVFSLGDASSLPTSKVSAAGDMVMIELTPDRRCHYRPDARSRPQPDIAHDHRQGWLGHLRRIHLVPAVHRPRGAPACRVQVRSGAKGVVRPFHRPVQAQPVSWSTPDGWLNRRLTA